MSVAVSGRDPELASLQGFVAGVADAAAALVLEGEAGMGKTTLWRAGVAGAEAQGLRVLQAVPAETETALSFSGIGDLLDPVLDEALAALPAGQKRALARALVLDEDDGPPPDAHAVGVALLGGLRALAEQRPVVVAVDDVQWLDAASSAGLAYAVRRLRAERVGVLLSRRSGLESALVDDVRRTFPDGRFTTVAVGPLDLGALHHVVQDHLGVALPRPLLAEVHGAAGGNPFYAIEIVRMLRGSGISVEAGQPLPVPESLHELVHARLLALPPESRNFLLAAAAHAHPTISLTETVSGVSASDGLPPALDARIVELEGERIRFTHPLLVAGAYETADPLRRREIHARLAELLEEPEARAWQLAASVEQPDAGVATVLEDAAQHARARGAPRPAALLLERAAALTPAEDAEGLRRRLVQAAYDHHGAGDTERALGLVRPASESTPKGPARAALLVALARFRSYDNDVRGASTLYREAIAEAESGSLGEAYAQEGLAGTLFRLREGLAEAVDVSGAAADTARRQGATQLEAEALATQAVSAAALGRPDAGAVADASVALQHACLNRPVLRQPLFAATCARFWLGDLDGAFAAYDAMATAAHELGDESSLPYTYVMLSQIECARGRLVEARTVAETGRAVAEQAGQRSLVAYTLAVRALADAHLGDIESAGTSSDRALELAHETSGIPAWIFATWAAGHLKLGQGDPAAAVSILRPLVEHHLREEIHGPGAVPFMPDAIEALAASGAFDEAATLLDAYAESAERLALSRALGVVHRLRGVLLAVRDDPSSALLELELAVNSLGAPDEELDRARSQLALGATQRRLKRRREARATLEEALVVFERIGAALWADRARAELKRISGRASSPGALTPAEERIATLVAEGKTNREVAATLYLSERTVEGHLSHVFGKLGIRHRTEVARALAARQTQGIVASNPGDAPVSSVPSSP